MKKISSKRIILFLFLSNLTSLMSTPLKTTTDAWDWVPASQWEFNASSSSLTNQAANGKVSYADLPTCLDYEFSAIVTIKKRLAPAPGWGTAGISLQGENTDQFYFCFLERPLNKGGERRNDFTIHAKGRKLTPDEYKVQKIFGVHDWKYNIPYQMVIKKQGQQLRLRLSSQDGAQCFSRDIELPKEVCVSALRPTLCVDGLQAEFREMKAMPGLAVQSSPASVFPAYRGPDSNTGVKAAGTGFFRTERMTDGREWVLDPNGNGFPVFGVDQVIYDGHSCELLGYFITRKHNDAHYASRAEWESETLTRMRNWGFNLLASHCDKTLFYREYPHAVNLALGRGFCKQGGEYGLSPDAGRPSSGFPNVFHPDFRRWCEKIMKEQVAPHQNDPWILGYYVDNELAWWSRGTAYGGMFDTMLSIPADHSAKQAFRMFLQNKFSNDIMRFNLFWGTKLADFDAINQIIELPDDNPAQRQLKRDFLELVAETYFKTVSETFKKYAPNHLLLGCRFAGLEGMDDIVWKMCGKYNDIVSLNIYPSVDLNTRKVYTDNTMQIEVVEEFNRIHAITNKPLLITEWSFLALDSGLPCTRGAGQRFRTQQERTLAAEIFARTLLAIPSVVGYDFFMWVDEPPLGISRRFPENGNYGLVNIYNQPYEELTAMFQNVQTFPEARNREALWPLPFQERNQVGEYWKSLLQKAIQPTDIPQGELSCLPNAQKPLTLNNGRWRVEISYDDGRFLLFRDGRNLGYLTLQLCYLNATGVPIWQPLERLDHVSAQISADGRLIVDYEGSNCSVSGVENGTFSLKGRLVMLDKADWILAQFCSIKNTDDARALRIVSAYLCLFPAFRMQAGTGEAVKNAWLPVKKSSAVPNLWSRVKYAGWISESDDSYIAAATGIRQNLNMLFWVDSNGGVHSDTWRKLDVSLPSQQTLTLEPPFFYLCYAGEAGEKAMQEKAEVIYLNPPGQQKQKD